MFWSRFMLLGVGRRLLSDPALCIICHNMTTRRLGGIGLGERLVGCSRQGYFRFRVRVSSMSVIPLGCFACISDCICSFYGIDAHFNGIS